MQRVATNVEEEMIVKAIQEEAPWDKLPKRLKLFLSSNEEYQKRVKEYCIKKRYKWGECAARNACKENEYYEDLVRYLRKNLALFPYHLAENVCRIQRISPFRYYIEMLYEVMKNERPYDSIPNFSAADALRLTGIGRNEFIDIMNKCRAKKLMWKINKSIVKEMLPTQPVDFAMEPWWAVSVVNLTVEEFRKLSEEEMAVISDKGGKDEMSLVGELDINVIRALYRRGLVYLDVPVYPDDHFQVSTLEGFVSNRDQQYEDPTEELLYAVFVASSEQATIAELAQTLQADLEQLQSAVALASRLGWAKKVLDPAALLRYSGMPVSPSSEGSGWDDGVFSPFASPFQEGASELTDVESFRGPSTSTRFAFLVDANLTSYLMMGSLSPGLKGHAVTLYEAGKLGDSSVADMCEDLQKVEGTKLEGELQEFADHAFSLRHALECLRSGGTDAAAGMEASGDGEGGDTDKNEKLGVSNDADLDFGQFLLEPSSLSESTPEEDFFGNRKTKESGEVTAASADFSMTSLLDLDTLEMTHLTSSSNVGDGLTVKGKSRVKKTVGRKFRVDVIRMESLAGLAPATVQRVVRRDYDIVVSMVPLPSPPSIVSPDGAGPVHFGPPSRASISPWMKLLLYETARAGPISVALMKGQCLRLLPPPLARCAKALVWAWDGMGVSGVGGKFEGTLVEGGILLHCVNSLLKHSAVLVQPFPRGCLDDGGKGKPVTKDIPLPLCEPLEGDSWQPHPSLVQAANELNLRTMGYIRLVQVPRLEDKIENQPPLSTDNECEWVPQSVEFGVPLFDTELCKHVCKGVVQSELFQAASLLKHREDMQKLRRRLLDLISDYQANGRESRLAYSGGSGGRPRTVSLNSSRWSLSDESSVDGLTTSLPQRRSEVGSFAGELPKVFVPVYEAPSRNAEALPTSNNPVGSKLDFGEDDDVSLVPLPGVNLLFDGVYLEPLQIGPCLQGRLPVALVAEAAAATEALRSSLLS